MEELALAIIMYLVPLIFVGGSIDLVWPHLTWPGRMVAIVLGIALLVWWWVT